MIEMASEKSSSNGGSGKISTTIRQHADGERDIATLEESANVAEAGKFDAADGACLRGGDVAHA
ncbi:MAG: hypothetical protein WCF80_08850 [Pseudolabrys sp.]|jgi:hypothetical protein